MTKGSLSNDVILVVGLSVMMFLLGVIFYNAGFNVIVPNPVEYVSFCNEVGMDYDGSWRSPVDWYVYCTRAIEHCREGYCMFTEERFAFDYPTKVGRAVR